MRIAGVIVTYNRKELLLKNIEMQLFQNRKADILYIIDNHSTDGTKQYFEDNHFDNIEYVYLDENTGGAGGFYTGMKKAYLDGYDYIWLMDDDGRPCNSDTLEELEKVANSLYQENNLLLVNSLVTVDNNKLTFGFSSKLSLNEQWNYYQHMSETNDRIIGFANPFNSTLISRELIAKIGYPNKDFFIIRDESDYLMRCRDADALISTALKSRYHHPRGNIKNVKFLSASIPLLDDFNKQYYWARNMTYSYKDKHKVRLFTNLSMQLICLFIYQDKKFNRLINWFEGVSDGLRGKLGKKA